MMCPHRYSPRRFLYSTLHLTGMPSMISRKSHELNDPQFSHIPSFTKKTITLALLFCATLSPVEGSDQPQVSRAQEINAQLQHNAESLNIALDVLLQIRGSVAKLDGKVESKRVPSEKESEKVVKMTSDEVFEKLVEAQIRVQNNIAALEKANNRCGLPPLVVKGVEAAKPGAIAGGAYKAWLLQNAPGASETLTATLVENGLIEARAISIATRVSRFLKSVGARAATVYVITFAAANAVIEAMDPDPSWCAYLAGTTEAGTLPPKKDFKIYKLALPALLGVALVLLFFWARSRGMFRS